MKCLTFTTNELFNEEICSLTKAGAMGSMIIFHQLFTNNKLQQSQVIEIVEHYLKTVSYNRNDGKYALLIVQELIKKEVFIFTEEIVSKFNGSKAPEMLIQSIIAEFPQELKDESLEKLIKTSIGKGYMSIDDLKQVRRLVTRKEDAQIVVEKCIEKLMTYEKMEDIIKCLTIILKLNCISHLINKQFKERSNDINAFINQFSLKLSL